MVCHREPAPLRRGHPSPGTRALAQARRGAQRQPGDPGRDRRSRAADRRRRDPAGARRGQRRRRVHRRDRVDAHVLAGADVDRRPQHAAQAAAAPPHAVRPRAAVGPDRHGLHEPQPVRSWRPRVRLHREPDGGVAQDGRRPLVRPAGAGADRDVDPRRLRLAGGAAAADRAVRRQHARRRGHRGRQGRRPDRVRGDRQRLRRGRAVRRGRERPRRRGGRAARALRRRVRRRQRSCGPTAPAANRWSRRRRSRWACARSCSTAAFARSPTPSRTWAGSISCRASRCSG